MDEQIVQLDPAKVLAEDNIRFNLKPLAVENLAADILERGQVLQPVEVEEIKGGGKHTHRLTSGFIRHAAVTKLNHEQKAGLTLPAIVRNTGDGLERMRHQISENMARESMSPMDIAHAADKLIKASVSRADIRRIFAKPSGKSKLAMQPLSNAMLNIYLRFLELPKGIQEKIHDGRVGVEAAYELGKVSPDRRQAVLDRAESDRQSTLEQEAKDEERYLESIRKVEATEAKVEETKTEIEKAKAEALKATQLVAEKKEAVKAVQKVDFLAQDEAGKKATMEKLKASQADVKAAEKLEKDAQNALAKLMGQRTAAEEKAKELREKLEAARKAPKKVVKKADIQKAAKAEGDAGYVALTISEVRDYVKDIMKAEHPRVAAIGKLFKDTIDGKWTPKELVHELALMTGEEKPAKPVKAAAAGK